MRHRLLALAPRVERDGEVDPRLMVVGVGLDGGLQRHVVAERGRGLLGLERGFRTSDVGVVGLLRPDGGQKLLRLLQHVHRHIDLDQAAHGARVGVILGQRAGEELGRLAEIALGDALLRRRHDLLDRIGADAADEALDEALDLALGSAPMKPSIGWPRWKANTAGIDLTPSCPAICGCSSMFILTSLTLPLAALTTFSSTGVSCLQGPHQGAQKSTSTGWFIDSCMTSCRKPCVVVSLIRPASAA